MRAALFTDHDTPIEIADLDLARPKANEVRVRIAAAGVCHSELHLTRGEWAAPAPLVPGHEGSGIVTEIGTTSESRRGPKRSSCPRPAQSRFVEMRRWTPSRWWAALLRPVSVPLCTRPRSPASRRSR